MESTASGFPCVPASTTFILILVGVKNGFRPASLTLHLRTSNHFSMESHCLCGAMQGTAFDVSDSSEAMRTALERLQSQGSVLPMDAGDMFPA